MSYAWALSSGRRRLLAGSLILAALNRSAWLAFPMSLQFFVDGVLLQGRTQLILPLVFALLAAILVQAGTSFTLAQTLSKTGQRLIAELRVTVRTHVGRLPVAYFDATKAGTLAHRIMNDVELGENLVGAGLIEFAGAVLTAGIALTAMLAISSRLTAIAFAGLIGFAVVLDRTYRVLRPMFRQRAQTAAAVTGRLTEGLGGVRVVKGYHAEHVEANVFSAGVERLLANILDILRANAIQSALSTVILGLVSVAVVWEGTRNILAGELTLGEFSTYLALLGFVISPAYQIAALGGQFTEAAAGLERTAELLRQRPEDDDARRGVALRRLEGCVEFEDVHFAYLSSVPVLGGVSFRAAPGTLTALVGPSGAGKSTIINLLAAFHPPSKGRVMIDGVDLATVRLDSYRTRLGLVLQETFLFDGTIRENVVYARPQASEGDVLFACRAARVDEFAETLPDRYHTVVGERGVKLSGGQRQRVSIARAILADPRILLLDEATSSLDSESEVFIQQALMYLMRGRTTFVIAHRLSTIRTADQILVIDGGKIVEYGTHGSLYRRMGRYHQMYLRQHGVDGHLNSGRQPSPDDQTGT